MRETAANAPVKLLSIVYFVLLPPLAAATPFMGLSDDSLMAQLMNIAA
jgi:hypothetical protein